MNINEIISYDLSLNPNRKQIQQMIDIAFEKFPSVEGVMFISIKVGSINTHILEIQ